MKAELELPRLRTANPADRVALRGVRVRSRLSGMSQRTTVEQTFVNLERNAIEAVYTFPLPESAAVCGFEVITGDRVLTGQVEEVEQAVERYEDAVGQGHGAFMVEENRPDVFTVRVGNLRPRQAATIRLTYVCPLERADNAIRVTFPTTVAPRYASGAGTDPLGAMIDGDALNPPHVLSVPYGLTLEVEVDLGRPVRRITSPSHSISHHGADAGETRSFVRLAAGVANMDRDVVLNIELPREHAPVAQAATGPGGASYLAVTFVPEFDVDELAQPEPAETVFVLDCSGSMQGDSIGQATAALELCLRSLSLGDTFNVCRFGSRFELMASEPLHYSEQTLQYAIRYVRQSGDLGGTELYAALHAVLTPPPRVGTRRQVILLTDGQVTNEPAVLELARQMRPHNRIFSFGIGAACSASLVKGLARATGGEAEFITPGERIDDKVLRTFARLASPMVSDVAVDWGGCDVQTLAELPPVFDGDVLTVFGRAPGTLPKTVTLSCRTQNGPARWDVPVPNAADDGGVIATMWARRTIQSLEEVNNLHAQRYRPGRRSHEAETLVSLSKQFGLLSSLTTFLAVEHRSFEERNEGRPALRRVPVMLARGWGGMDDPELLRGGPVGCLANSGTQALDALLKYSMDAEEAPRHSALRGGIKRRSAAGADGVGSGAAAPGAAAAGKGKSWGILGRFSSMKKHVAPPAPAPASAPASAPPPMVLGARAAGAGNDCIGHDDLHAMLAALNADGSFGPVAGIDRIFRAAGHDPAGWNHAIERSLPAAAALPQRDAVVRTVMALLLLRARFAGQEPSWRRAAAKAVRYVEQALGGSAGDVRQWLKDLEAALPAAASPSGLTR